MWPLGYADIRIVELATPRERIALLCAFCQCGLMSVAAADESAAERDLLLAADHKNAAIVITAALGDRKACCAETRKQVEPRLCVPPGPAFRRAAQV